MYELLLVAGITVAVLVAALLIYASMKPNRFTVKRAATMQATRDIVFPYVNDFHLWEMWSPWEKLDPAMQRTHVGPASGVGAVYEWDGNSKAGAGRMEIIKSVEPKRVVINLQFIRPFRSLNSVEFTFEAKDSATLVTWTMDGPCPFIMKIMHVFINMDAMIGKDFDKGLASIKALAEAQK